ncbi:MAG: lytic transglycosylase domain-containing protein [Alphaproteobacteria bacterium]|nr:lytic transglycosylase domain-containing protein [Alphaproteobacteria bacterium]MCB9974065.1 lytic transglycosylase domain-containing protein [Rhodospirillales bacterium]
MFRKVIVSISLILCGLLLSAPVSARNTEISRVQTSAARKMTIEAIRDFRDGKKELARKRVAESRDPLAAKIYHWLIFTRDVRNWNPSHYTTLTRFIRQNPDWPGIRGLKSLAEDKMPENWPSADILGWFNDYPPRTARGMKIYIDALIAQGREKQARQILVDWWADANISRDQQRDIFQRYGNILTVEAHKRRFDSLLLKGQGHKDDSARAIAGVLGNGYPELAEARIALARGGKKGIDNLVSKVPKHLQDDPGLLFERLRWRRKNNDDFGAMEILHAEPDPGKVLNPDDWWAERQIIIRRLLEQGSYKSAYLLAEIHMQKDGLPFAEAQFLTGWLALRFMNKPTEAFERFTSMYAKVETPISKSRASYWAGRAAEAMKQKSMALKWYRNAAKFQTVYYGQLAGIKLQMRNELPKVAPPVLTRADKDKFAENDLTQAAQLFKAAGMEEESGDFLEAFIQSEDSPKAYRYGAELAAKMGDVHEAIKIAKKATGKGLFLTAQSYPTITKWIEHIDSVEWALIHSVIRQESVFDFNARSPSGARGLMQLMPGTAAETARKINVAHKGEWLTERPDHNILLGTTYLHNLLKRYDGAYPLAIAAYNAGPGRVNKWLETYGDPRKGEVDMIDWIELIPYSETRNYVQRVMENIYVYRLRLKGVQPTPEREVFMLQQAKP